MANYRPIDSKREEFRKYLERAGVMDALTKALVCLYEEQEKPVDALEYVRKVLGDNRPDATEIQGMKDQIEECLLSIETLKKENLALKEKLAVYEPEEVKEETADEPAKTDDLPAEATDDIVNDGDDTGAA